MATLVSIDAHNGILRRYEVGGESYRMTHEFRHETKPVNFGPLAVEQMRLDPPDEFSVKPDPLPPAPPGRTGTVSAPANEKDNGFVETAGRAA